MQVKKEESSFEEPAKDESLELKVITKSILILMIVFTEQIN